MLVESSPRPAVRVEICKSVNQKIWESGNPEVWESENLKIWESGNPELWYPKTQRTKLMKVKMHSAQNVSRVLISRKKNIS